MLSLRAADIIASCAYAKKGAGAAEGLQAAVPPARAKQRAG